MNPNTAEIVAKLWKECKTLQSAGVSYSNYVNELTYLLFLKMLEETGQESRLPNGHCWSRLAGIEGGDQLEYYKRMLLELGNPKETHDPVVLAIFTDAMTHLRLPKDLKTLTTNIDKLDWFTAREDGLGDLYEGLLEKTTSATKSKAGQYFRVNFICYDEVRDPLSLRRFGVSYSWRWASRRSRAALISLSLKRDRCPILTGRGSVPSAIRRCTVLRPMPRFAATSCTVRYLSCVMWSPVVADETR